MNVTDTLQLQVHSKQQHHLKAYDLKSKLTVTLIQITVEAPIQECH